MDIENLNKEIKNRYDLSSIYNDQLADDMLIDKFMKAKSTKIKLKNIKTSLLTIFKNYNVEQKSNKDELIIMTNGHLILLDETIKCLSQFIIEPGVKGMIRGNKFNEIVFHFLKNEIKNLDNLKLKKERKIKFLNEKADWVLTNKKTNKKLIGYNQLTLWGGGQQSNRAGYYINNNDISNKCINNNSLLVCVIARYPGIIKSENKIYKLFYDGFRNGTLYYLFDLKNVITKIL